ncbi:MAG: GNAT family N-acetyltransferase [Gemmatimonadetes bacterium]|nr:GNAT family N-acetyltransferase [Gemmatimonadota bacterium]
MTIRRPDPRGGGEVDPVRDPLASAVWIRPFRDEDAPAVRAIVARVLEEFDLALDPAGVDADLADVEAEYRVAGGEFWVVEDGRSRIVGTCGLWIDPEHPERAELRKMYLEPGLRGLGMGRRLLAGALDHARRAGCRVVDLETNREMKAAIALYERHGFRRVGGETCDRCDVKLALDLE